MTDVTKIDSPSCNGQEHRVRIDVVTFIEVPDERFMFDVYGDNGKISNEIAEFKAKVNPNASVYYEYCCDACKEAVNGNGS